MVVIVYPHPIKELTLDPATARAIGETLIERSKTCVGEKQLIVASPEEIFDAKLLTKIPALRKKVAFRLRKMAEAGLSNARCAEELIDMVLHEVT